ncbi:hypothetical protein [Ornithinicoccus hortensis]|uniref:Lipoprotein n=1 Tax=Ornithinicoccus hortensis TaxID=82346 RepID=A0A542YR17_9MICO|nr:hypothetical protein [Ornithinicoccus hortensis]TQL50507.1 hypothetical protein FB467_1618 [Ornithinicoccus hortensis]
MNVRHTRPRLALGLATLAVALGGCGTATGPGAHSHDASTATPSTRTTTPPPTAGPPRAVLGCDLVQSASIDYAFEPGMGDDTPEEAIASFVSGETGPGDPVPDGRDVEAPPGSDGNGVAQVWHRIDDVGEVVAVLHLETTSEGRFVVGGIDTCSPATDSKATRGG